MRRPLMIAMLVVVVAGLVAVPTHAQRTHTFEQITVADTAIGITSTIYAGMTGCAMRLETAQIRFRIDAAPTSSVGTILDPGDILTLERIEDAGMIKFIRTGATSGLLGVWCWAR